MLRSPEPLALGHWHRVSAERLNKDGSLRVNSRPPVLRSSPGKSQGLNLHTLLYLGGVEPSVRLPPATNISAHFRGCVGEVRSRLRRPTGEGRGEDKLTLPPHTPTVSPKLPVEPGSLLCETERITPPSRSDRTAGRPWHAGSSLACAGIPRHHSCSRLGSQLPSTASCPALGPLASAPSMPGAPQRPCAHRCQ